MIEEHYAGLIAIATGNVVVVIDAETLAVLGTLTVKDEIEAMKFGYSGEHLDVTHKAGFSRIERDEWVGQVKTTFPGFGGWAWSFEDEGQKGGA